MTFHPLVTPLFLLLFGLLWFVLVSLGYARSDASSGKSVLTAARRSILGGLVLVILAGPAVPVEGSELTSNVEIFLAVDRTGSMAAKDWQGDRPRLEGVKRDVQTLVQSTPGSRYSIITWDSTARIELPVTTDSSAVTSFADSLHQEISEFSVGSALNRPVSILIDTLGDSARDRPESIRYLIVITDGEDTDLQALGGKEQWEWVAELIDGGAVIGYGTEQGGPMRTFVTGSGQREEYIEDPDNPGSPAISQMDPEALADLAAELSVPLLVNPEELQVENLGEQIMAEAQLFADARSGQMGFRYVIWPFALAVFGLLLWEAKLLVARAVVLRRSDAL